MFRCFVCEMEVRGDGGRENIQTCMCYYEKAYYKMESQGVFILDFPIFI